jgi:hypothetical protein
MFSAIRKRVTPATVIATCALVFAMSGGAYAANKFLITSTKQISPKVLKSLQGKAGARGATGAQGPAGAAGAGSPGSQGPAGAAGAKGDTGASGTPGEPGAPGTNGKNGTNGKEGSPWTAGGTLPSGKTETGVWNMEGVTSINKTQISFAVPLAEPLTWSEGKLGEPENQVHYINPSGKEVQTFGVEVAVSIACPGSVEKPAAAPGNLCIYAHLAHTEDETISNETILNPSGQGPGGLGASTAGSVLDAGEGTALGTWAVTAK